MGNRIAVSRLLWILVGLALTGCTPVRSKARTKIETAMKTGKYVSAGRMIDVWLKLAPRDTSALSLDIRLLSDERHLDQAIDVYRRYYRLARVHSRNLLLMILLAAFKATDDHTCAQAIRVSGEFDLHGATDAIYDATRDRHPEIQCEAYTAIGKLKDSTATDQLMFGCMDDDPHVRTAAIIATGKHGDTLSRALTRVCTFDPIDYNRWRVVVMRAQLGDRRMLRYLREQISADYDILSLEAAACLVELGYVDYLPVLVHGLTAVDVSVRCAAVASLCELKEKQYLPALLTLAADTCDRMRAAVAQGLGEMGDTAAAATLLVLTQDKDPDTRAAAAMSLPGIFAQAAETSLVQLLGDSSAVVRVSAVGSLLSLIDTSRTKQPGSRETRDIDDP